MPIISSPLDLLVLIGVPALFLLVIVWAVRAIGIRFAPDRD
jgi:hypothetical protein